MRHRTYVPFAAIGLALACGDGEGGSGSLRVQLSAEESITSGLASGADPEQTRDCAVAYDKYLVAIGRVKLARGGEMRGSDAVYVADLKQVGTQGPEIASFPDLPSGQWERFEYETPAAAAGALPLGTLAPGDLDVMVAKGLTYWIEGSVSCPERSVRFTFQVAVPTRYYECESDGEPGVAVGGGGASTALLTLHGDHLWFDALPNGSEGTVMRRAGWILKADADGDGRVVTEDLSAVRAEEAFPSALGYNLGGASISNALDFVRAQLGTQGHLNGEGECQWAPL